MEADRFPLFISLEGKKAVVVGAGPIGLRRAEVLLSFGAQVTVIAPRAPGLSPRITYLPRAYEPGDLQGAFLAVAATDSRQVNRQIGLEARALSIPVSVSDSREECTFFFPAVCRGQGLTAGLVSQGTEHRKVARIAQKIRELLEECL